MASYRLYEDEDFSGQAVELTEETVFRGGNLEGADVTTNGYAWRTEGGCVTDQCAIDGRKIWNGE